MDEVMASTPKVAKTLTPKKLQSSKSKTERSALKEATDVSKSKASSSSLAQNAPVFQCRMCDFVIRDGSGRKLSNKVRQRIVARRKPELVSALQANLRDGTSVKFSGLGTKRFIKPIPFEKVKKADWPSCAIVGPYCLRGVRHGFAPRIWASLKTLTLAPSYLPQE